MGMNSTWGRLVLKTMVAVNDWRGGIKPNLSVFKQRLWLWKDMGVGVESQRILRSARNSMMYRVKITVGEIICAVSGFPCLLLCYSTCNIGLIIFPTSLYLSTLHLQGT